MKRIVFVFNTILFATTLQAQQDSLQVSTNDFQLQEVTVQTRRSSVQKSRINAVQTEKITADELCKAACCNLSESFETNASVDAAYADAATGAKQIRLLGLNGTYVQFLTENTPSIRGLAQSFGMEYIPGPWMQSIQISKGTSTVINGYEATAGQINVEYLKPKTADPLAVNLMLNTELHAEANLTGGWEINENVSTAVLAHYQNASMPMDDNYDGFIDMPTGQQANLLNRWDIFKGHYTGRVLLRGLYDERNGGQLTHGKHKVDTPHPYQIGLRTWRVEGFMKNGYVFDHTTNTSIGIITSFSYHNQQNQYGHRLWNATQTNLYLNAMYQTNFTDEHKLTAGFSTNYDRYNEQLTLDSNPSTLLPHIRHEVTPGIFAEYSYTLDERLSLLAGMRVDWSSRYGFFFTPRMNIRYTPWDWWIIRGSIGMGYRSPNLIADNAALLASNRQFVLLSDKIAQEKALNAGISTTFYIPLGKRELQLSAEYYYTHFFEALLANTDISTHHVYFYNLTDTHSRSFSSTWQIEAQIEILRGWTLTAAFRQTDVLQPYINANNPTIEQTNHRTIKQKALTPRFKGLISTSYQTPLKKWQFDFTAQFTGGGRMPDASADNPLWANTYKWYPQLMGQITKYWRHCSLYVGGENLTNYKQKNPIIAADNPFGADFDASMVYAPISGWKLYIGFRYNLEKKDND